MISISVLLVLSIFSVLFTVLRQKGPLIPHDAIIIWKDEDFLFYDFPGDGTPDNPFQIKNYNITTESRNGIYITNTTLHFIVENCYINAKDNGIYIERVAGGTFSILNNECSKNYNGIIISHTNFFSISNNTVETNIASGISLTNTNFTVIENNTVSYNGEQGLIIYYTRNSTVRYNSFNMNGESGIMLISSLNSVINNNYLYQNDVGTSVWWSDFTQICNNSFIENRRGFENHEAEYTNAWLNYFQENEQHAVYITSNSDYNMIHHNSFIDNNLEGTSQAYSEYAVEWWYDIVLLEGNYWNDWISGPYQIDSVYPIYDPYPLTEPPV